MQEALHRSIIYADTQRSGAFDDYAKAVNRESIHSVFAESLDAIGVTWRDYSKEDRGDGVLITVESSIPETRLAGRLISDVDERLREMNRGRRNPLRMRVGLNSGPVRRDAHGVCGTAVDTAARMANSDAARDTLAGAVGANLAVFISDAFYRSIIQSGGPYIDAGLYRPIAVHTRTLHTTVWTYVPRMGLSSEPEEGSGSEDKPYADEAAKAPEAPARNTSATPPQHVTTRVTNKVREINGDHLNFGIINSTGGSEFFNG